MSRLISLSLTLLLGATSPTYANEKVTNVGSVTIDGIPIPELHYQVYADRFIYDSKLICPPVSDAFIRDQVIGVWLRHSQGLKDD